jgi:hypothetical protein
MAVLWEDSRDTSRPARPVVPKHLNMSLVYIFTASKMEGPPVERIAANLSTQTWTDNGASLRAGAQRLRSRHDRHGTEGCNSEGDSGLRPSAWQAGRRADYRAVRLPFPFFA